MTGRTRILVVKKKWLSIGSMGCFLIFPHSLIISFKLRLLKPRNPMFLKQLHLRAFRNYLEQEIEFTAQKTILVGQNAQGKSNLLEAVELLATLKSHRTFRDRELILEGAANGQIHAIIERQYSIAELDILLRRNGRRNLQVNATTARRQVDFLGIINAIEFSCLDLELVRGAPECRRQWLDTLLVQLEPVYAHILGQYQHILKQRNSLLKSLRKQQEVDTPLDSQEALSLELWDQQLIEMGARVARRRARCLARLTPLATEWHARISGGKEELTLTYHPSVTWESDEVTAVQQALAAKLQQRRLAELHLGATVVGPHRDEISLMIDGTPAKTYGSQGQQRTLVLALKLTELSLVETVVGEPPLLLLDDVLAELDLERQSQLLNAVEDRFQTLITTTHLNRFDDQWRQSAQILQVKQGQIHPCWLSELEEGR